MYIKRTNGKICFVLAFRGCGITERAYEVGVKIYIYISVFIEMDRKMYNNLL